MPELAATDTGGKPFAFPRPSRPEPPPEMVRVPALAEIAGLLEWVFPLVQRHHPRAMLSPIRQLMAHATTGPQNPPMRLLRTENAMALFIADRDGFEPEYQVRTKFLVHREAPDEAEAIRAAALDWAKTIGAITFDGKPIERVAAKGGARSEKHAA